MALTLPPLKPVASGILSVLFLVGAVYGIYASGIGVRAYANARVLLYGPCADPVTYSIAAYDPRFGISRAEFESDLKQAAAVWNTAASHTVVEEAITGDVQVKMVYGDRQQAVEVGSVIKTEQATYAAKKQALDSLKADFSTAQAAYQSHKAAYEASATTYQQEVSYWNAQGGAPADEYRKSKAERAMLDTSRAALDSEAASLNATANSINAKVEELNAYAAKTNQTVETFNKVAGQDFDQGNYVENADGRSINIYEFETEAELRHVLAHEFGHALGLGHNDNPDSVMYAYDTNPTVVLSPEDTAALKAACKLK